MISELFEDDEETKKDEDKNLRTNTAVASAPKAFFFPLEYFDDILFDSQPLIEKLKQVKSQIILSSKETVNGYSKWNFPSGEFDWAPCRVLSFDTGKGYQCIIHHVCRS